MRLTYTAAEIADNADWDGEYFVKEVGRSALWETAKHTRGGRSIRLMRLDNETLKVHRLYVPLDVKMELVWKGSIK